MEVAWSDWQVVKVAMECGTFSAAAAVLGVGQATVSRRVAAVEEVLGQPLFDRHRTGLVPTPAGRQLVPHLEALAAAADATRRAVEGLEREPRGEVRLAGPPGLCVDWAPRLAAGLAHDHPQVTLTVLADILPRDLERREADVALRMVPTERGDLVVRKLATFGGGLYAHPGYVARLPARPEARDVAVVTYADELADIALARLLASLGARVALRSNDYLVQRAAVQAGLGAGLFSDVEARGLGLVPVPLPLPPSPVASLYLVVHRALRHVPRVAVVIEAIDALVAELEPSASHGPSPGARGGP